MKQEIKFTCKVCWIHYDQCEKENKMTKKIEFYGAYWCGDCVRAKAFLDENSISYEYIDVDFLASAAAKVEQINHGKRIIPTIIVDNKPLTNPSNAILSEELGLDILKHQLEIVEGAGCSLDNPGAC